MNLLQLLFWELVLMKSISDSDQNSIMLFLRNESLKWILENFQKFISQEQAIRILM